MRGFAGRLRHVHRVLYLAVAVSPVAAALPSAVSAATTAARIEMAQPAGCSAAQIAAGTGRVPAGHYGGAPDGLPTGYRTGAAIGHFPTRYMTRSASIPGTTGAFTVRADQEWLGQPDALERDAGRGKITADCDPGEAEGPLVALSPLRLFVTVSVARSAPAGLRYLNALVDLDGDGRWNGANAPREWVVRNCAIALSPGRMAVRVGCPWIQAASLSTVASHATTLPPGKLYPLPPLWSRVLLTRAPLSAALYGRRGWDGAGPERGFPFGNVEDYLAGSAASGSGARRPSPTPTFPVLPTSTRPRPAATSIIPRPTPTVSPTSLPIAAATGTPTPVPSATSLAQTSPTQPPAGTTLPYVSASHQYDPATGLIQFRLRLAPLAPQNEIYGLRWEGAPWTGATTGIAPPGWSWMQSGNGWQAVTPGTPLFFGEIVYFGLSVPPGSDVPDRLQIPALDAGGHTIGEIESVNLTAATATLTAIATSTNTPTVTATALPMPGIVAYHHFLPTTGLLVLDVLATAASSGGQIYRVDLPGPPWSEAIPGSLSAGWHWQHLDGGQEVATTDHPIQPNAGLSLQLTLRPPTVPPMPLVLLAFDAFGRLLGQITSLPQ